MPSLKDLKNRIASVKSTRKITSAMKMVAASKLRRAQDLAESSRPYTGFMNRMMTNVVASIEVTGASSPLLIGNGKKETVLLVVMTSDRGLCGAFNGSIIRETRRQIAEMEKAGQKVKLVCVGRRARDLLRREHGDKFLYTVESSGGTGKKAIDIEDARSLAAKLVEFFETNQCDVVRLLFNKFHSAISQVVTLSQIIPFVEDIEQPVKPTTESEEEFLETELFEPTEDTLVQELLARNIVTQVYAALLESSAGEQGARMTAMDNATRNAGDMIDRLTLNYNRSRQACITNELIEIISGAEAV
ncbi:MAG: F0F1 ATP synthase subunit gamma [Bdellovibrionales bacterium]